MRLVTRSGFPSAARLTAARLISRGFLGCFAMRLIGAPELLEQHVAELRIGLVDADRIHQLLDVVIYVSLARVSWESGFAGNGRSG